MFMSPSCVCDAVEASPRTHGDERAVPAFLPGTAVGRTRSRAVSRHASRRPSMWPVDSACSPVNPGQRVERSIRADGVRVLHVDVARARCARRRASETRAACVSSRRNAILSSRKLHESHVDPPPVADVRHARAVQRLAVVGADRDERQHALRRRRRLRRERPA